MQNNETININNHPPTINNPLKTMTMTELYDTAFEPRLPVIEGLMGCGTFILAGPPKVGKSFLVMQIAYSVAKGVPLWNRSVHQGDVLYLALEDNFQRLQQRLSLMFGVEETEHLHMAITSKTIRAGLMDQIRDFRNAYPNTRLVIIDTLQKVRDPQDESYSYQRDYEFICELKKLTDKDPLCILIVHHTRKQEASDSVARISGTTGISGAADGSYILDKTNRVSDNASLEVTTRDMPDQKLKLKRDLNTCQWLLVDEDTYAIPSAYDSVLAKIAEFVTDGRHEWSGNASALLMECNGLSELIAGNALVRKLNVKAQELLSEHHVLYRQGQRSGERKIFYLTDMNGSPPVEGLNTFTETTPTAPMNDDMTINDGISGTGPGAKISSQTVISSLPDNENEKR